MFSAIRSHSLCTVQTTVHHLMQNVQCCEREYTMKKHIKAGKKGGGVFLSVNSSSSIHGKTEGKYANCRCQQSHMGECPLMMALASTGHDKEVSSISFSWSMNRLLGLFLGLCKCLWLCKCSTTSNIGSSTFLFDLFFRLNSYCLQIRTFFSFLNTSKCKLQLNKC